MLGLIPARKNSKGIPGKNVVELCGRPLIGWAIEAALNSQRIDQVVVSTDCPEIASVARSLGAETPFLRPPQLALDETSGIEPVIHACTQLPDYSEVILLQPTSPLRTTHHIDSAIDLFRERGTDFLVSVTHPKHHPNWVFVETNDGTLRKFAAEPVTATRQALTECFALNGAIYIAKVASLLKEKTFLTESTIPFVMGSADSVDIDTPDDLLICEALMKAKFDSSG